MPNLTLEVATSGRTSLSAEIFGSRTLWNHRFRTIGIAPEFRWWLSGRTFDRFFLGVGMKAMHYDFEWKGEARKGDTGGLGLTFGYDLYLGRHWTLDFSAGIGAMGYWQQHAPVGEDIFSTTYREKGISIVPYQVGVSIIYIIK